MNHRTRCPGCGLELEVHATTAIRLTAGPEARLALLVEQVAAIVREHGPISAGKVASTARRRKADVVAALRQAEAAERIRHTAKGWTR
jgi:hypothetical protein